MLYKFLGKSTPNYNVKTHIWAIKSRKKHLKNTYYYINAKESKELYTKINPNAVIVMMFLYNYNFLNKNHLTNTTIANATGMSVSVIARTRSLLTKHQFLKIYYSNNREIQIVRVGREAVMLDSNYPILIQQLCRINSEWVTIFDELYNPITKGDKGFKSIEDLCLVLMSKGLTLDNINYLIDLELDEID